MLANYKFAMVSTSHLGFWKWFHEIFCQPKKHRLQREQMEQHSGAQEEELGLEC